MIEMDSPYDTDGYYSDSYYSFHSYEDFEEYYDEIIPPKISRLNKMTQDWMEWNEFDINQCSLNSPIPLNTPSQKWVIEWKSKNEKISKKEMETDPQNSEMDKKQKMKWTNLFELPEGESLSMPMEVQDSSYVHNIESESLKHSPWNEDRPRRLLRREMSKDTSMNEIQREDSTRPSRLLRRETPPTNKETSNVLPRENPSRLLCRETSKETSNELQRETEIPSRFLRRETSTKTYNEEKVSKTHIDSDGFTYVKKRSSPILKNSNPIPKHKKYLLCIHGKDHSNSSCLMAHSLEEYEPKLCRYKNCNKNACEYKHSEENMERYLERMFQIPNSFFERNKEKYKKEYLQKMNKRYIY